MCPPPVGSRGVKRFHREPTAFWLRQTRIRGGVGREVYRLGVGSLCWRVFEFVAEKVLGGRGVAGCGVVADAED
jgi:hypothetical protein